MELIIEKESRCSVVGHGSWATGLVKILSEGGQRVGWFVRNGDVLDSLRDEGRNPKYLSDVEFDTSLLALSGDIGQVVEQSDVVVLAAPSAFLKDYLGDVSLRGKFVVSAVKGVVPGNHLTITDFLEQFYGVPKDCVGVIGGPSHAEEIALERLSYLTVACQNLDNARVMAYKLSAKYIKTAISTDIHGVEYAAILKNIYALGVGIATGLGYGDNFLSVLISNSAREMAAFLDAAYPCERDTNCSAYLGDLLVTAYSPFSRNRRFGMMIGKGLHVKSALMELGGVAEGYYAAEIMRQTECDMPIARAVYDILYGGAVPSRTMKNLTNKLI